MLPPGVRGASPPWGYSPERHSPHPVLTRKTPSRRRFSPEPTDRPGGAGILAGTGSTSLSRGLGVSTSRGSPQCAASRTDLWIINPVMRAGQPSGRLGLLVRRGFNLPRNLPRPPLLLGPLRAFPGGLAWPAGSHASAHPHGRPPQTEEGTQALVNQTSWHRLESSALQAWIVQPYLSLLFGGGPRPLWSFW